MEKHEYLSPGWLEAIREVRARYASTHDTLSPLIVNFTISDVPGHDGAAEFHLDARSPLYYEPGHHADPAYAIATDYATAKEIYGDTTWGMEKLTAAHEAGTLTLDGDPDEVREAWADAIRARDYMEVLDEIAQLTA